MRTRRAQVARERAERRRYGPDEPLCRCGHAERDHLGIGPGGPEVCSGEGCGCLKVRPPLRDLKAEWRAKADREAELEQERIARQKALHEEWKAQNGGDRVRASARALKSDPRIRPPQEYVRRYPHGNAREG